MDSRLNDPYPQRGYSLIELLVVLAIVGILAFVGISQLAPRSPKAVRSGLQEVGAALKQARGLAMVGGKNVDFVFSTNPARLQVFDLKADGSLNAEPLMDVSFGKSWQRNATIFLTVPPPVGTETDPVEDIKSLVNLGFKGWTTGPLTPGTSLQGFSPAGTPQSITGGVRAVTTDGLWLGIAGTTKNDQGIPYGVVLITGNGMIETYYKSDSSKSGATYPEAAWQRLD